MLDLTYLSDTYSFNHLSSDELMHLQGWMKVKGWLSKSDIEKQECRRSYLRMLQAHFKEDGLEYVEQSIVFTDCILIFFTHFDYSDTKYEECSTEEEKALFRIYNMLWCEKEYILYMENPKATKVHVSMDVFRPLIDQVKDTKEYVDYKLDVLFEEYEKMLDLFKSAYPS